MNFERGRQIGIMQTKIAIVEWLLLKESDNDYISDKEKARYILKMEIPNSPDETPK